jgi:putative two-component system response regulator
LTQSETVLIVDDETGIRRILSQVLSVAGYLCLEASNAEEAMERFRSHPVDIALLDINMPGRSGTQLLGDVTRDYPDVAIIMLTAISDSEVCIDCMRHGAFDYIIKPFNNKELLVRMNQALEKRRLRLENRDYQQHLEEKVHEQAERIRSDYFNALTSLAQALEAKDKYTSGHSRRVADISAVIASQMGKSGDEIAQIRMAAMVHDIGKIGINESILNKPGRLTEAEHAQFCLHSEIGERILKPITSDAAILSMVRHHHERYDGTGYPDGLKGNHGGSSGTCGILAMADAYDAMTSDRPYRKALPLEQAIKEIRDNAGKQFDPAVVAAFLKIEWSAKNPK